MAGRFLTDEGKQALTAMIREIESRSCAEVVIAVRPASGSYLHADLLAGGMGALATLAFLLYSPWSFDLMWFLIDPSVAGLAVGLVVSRLPRVRRLLTFPGMRTRQVEQAARAAFVEKRIHQTRGRTGLLIYISLLERQATLVADIGVEAAVPQDKWAEATAKITDTVRRGGDALAVAAAADDLASLLELTLERSDDDVNELADEVDTA